MTGRRKSLGVRILMLTSVLLIVAFGLTLFLLDAIFRQVSESTVEEFLAIQALALIGAADVNEVEELTLPEQLPEPRLMSLGSGLYAEILDNRGARLWRSRSAMGLPLARRLDVRPGERVFRLQSYLDGTTVLIFGLGVAWELESGRTRNFQIYVAEDTAAFQRQLAQFRRQLMGWFGGLILAILAALWMLLRWGLKPLRRMAGEIAAIESGETELLSEAYPRELAGVARNMNALIRSERQRIVRFRTTMDDLAHSLKTPLAVLRSELEGTGSESETLRNQVGRMQGVVDYQLRRAAATGPRTLAANDVAIKPICIEVASSLRKIHRDKEVTCDIEVPDGTKYPAEQGDIYELVGNLLDNAWKWCEGRIRLQASIEKDGKKSDAGVLLLTVGDDGPGISESSSATLLDRGTRAEPRGDVPGQGIGLAVVTEICELYGGSLDIGASDLGGAEFRLRLPY
jgi:two-component system sensor histidine kinase PhoQ